MSDVTVLYRRPGSRGEQQAPVGSVAEVKALANDLRSAHHDHGYTAFPGIALVRGNPQAPDESIAIGVSDGGWAMIHSDAEVNQLSTRAGSDVPNGPMITVLFDQPDDIPATWFIPEERALSAVDAWLTGNGVDREIFVGPDC